MKIAGQQKVSVCRTEKLPAVDCVLPSAVGLDFHIDRGCGNTLGHEKRFHVIRGRASGVEMPHVRHIYHAFTVRSSERDALQKSLAASGVQTS